MVNFRPKLLFLELLLFLLVQSIGLVTALAIKAQVVLPPKLEMGSSVIWFVVAFMIATAAILILLRFSKVKMPFGALFSLLVVVGSQAVFATIMVWWLAFILAIGLAALRFFKPNVLIHNVAIILAVAGVGAQVGLTLHYLAVIILLVVLSVYDYIAVFKTKHMVSMFKSMMSTGAPLSIVVSDSKGSWTQNMQRVGNAKLKNDKKEFIMLGTGDLAFPLIFAVAALDVSLISAISVILGSLVGILIIHWLVLGKKISALPALPPLAITSIIAFGISLLF